MRRILVSTALVIGALTLVGCTAESGSSSSDAGGSVAADRAPADAEYSAGDTTDSASLEAAPDLTVEDTREVITTGSASITVEDPIAAAQKAVTTVETAGGRVDGRQEYAPTDGDNGSASLTLRIPSTKLTATIEELKELGEVENVSLTSSDVTVESQDLEARITAARASFNRLLDLLENATSTKDLISLESAISERQGALESMEAQKRGLDDQVALSTLELSLTSVADAPADEPDTFASGLTTGWDSFVAFLAGALVAIGVMIPWVAFFGILAAIGLVAMRLVRRRRQRAASSASPSSAS